MIVPEPDTRSPERKAADERTAAGPHDPVPDLPPDTPLVPVEVLLAPPEPPPGGAGWGAWRTAWSVHSIPTQPCRSTPA